MKYKIFTFLICLIISFALWYFAGHSQKETVNFSSSAPHRQYVPTEVSPQTVSVEEQKEVADTISVVIPAAEFLPEEVDSVSIEQ